MNPIYTGKDVSYIDTKQANRAAENAVLRRRAVRGVRRRCSAAPTYPQAALAKAWVQLAYGAHHDAITGSESDQVYLDLLTGWRDAHDLGRDVLRGRARPPAGRAAGAHDRRRAGDRVQPVGLAAHRSRHRRRRRRTTPVARPAGARAGRRGRSRASSSTRSPMPTATITRRRRAVRAPTTCPGIGHSAGWSVQPADDDTGWRTERRRSTDIENDALPGRGRSRRAAARCVGWSTARRPRAAARRRRSATSSSSTRSTRRTRVHNEGPWHLLPTGAGAGALVRRAAESVVVAAQRRSAVGWSSRGRLGDCAYTQTITLRDGSDRVDCRTTLDDSPAPTTWCGCAGPAALPGALPASEVGNAVVGRGFGLPRRRTSPSTRGRSTTRR